MLVLMGALVYVGYILGQRLLQGDGPAIARHVADRIRVPQVEAFGQPRIMRTIYLNREGARLRGGPDDAQVNQSSIVAHAGLGHADIPAFAGTPSRWDTIVRCIASKLEPFDVRVVDQRPMGEDYMMAMMGGTAKVLGDYGAKQHHHSLGLSPYNGDPIADAVILIFTRAARENTRKVCETTGMEIGHAYGLDHARHCRDLMTYLPSCGVRRFLDRDIPCGEKSDRPCKPGKRPSQNSYQHLLALLGPRAEPVAAPDK
jgi:hypothetical protein